MDSNISEVTISEPKAYELLKGSSDKDIPILTTRIRDGRAKLRVYTNENNSTWPRNNEINIEVDVSQVDNVSTSLEMILSQLQSKTDQHNIKKCAVKDSDELFTFYTAQQVKAIANKLLKSLNIMIIPSPTYVRSEEEQKYLVEIYHNNLLVGGHPGKKRLYAKLKQKYTWKNMSRDVAEFVESCNDCLLNKIKVSNREPLVMTKTPQSPFDKVIIDTIGPLSVSEEGNKYAVTMICDLTKYVIAYAIPNKEALTVAKAVMNSLILVYGVPTEILSDLGTEYKNEIFAHLTELLKMKHSFSTPHRHQTVGSIERNHRSFNEHLRIYLPQGNHTWDELLRYFVFTYNTTPNISLGLKYSPFELIFGKIPKLIECTRNNELDPVYNIDDFVVETKFRLQLAHLHAQDLLNKAKIRNKLNFDKNCNPINLTKGNTVVVTNDGRKQKHEPTYKGPFIVDSINESNVMIKDPRDHKLKEIHKNRLRKVNK